MNRTVETLLKINAMLAAISLIGSAFVGATSVVTLFAVSPFIPDQQEEVIKDFILKTPVAIGLSFSWVVGCAIVGVKLYQSEIDPMDDLVEVARQKQKSLAQCRSCHYLVRDRNAAAYLKYPCAVHPKGKPSEVCGDWANFWLKYYEEEKVFESR